MSLWSNSARQGQRKADHMPGTGIQLVRNDSSHNLLFVVLENTGKSQYIDPKTSSTVDCVVPWCSSHDDFRKKGIIIINRFQKTVLGYIWQDKDSKNDDRVRLWFTGWETPSLDNRMPGESVVGGKINLIISSEGKISAEKASP
jgi:hypothetical protein